MPTLSIGSVGADVRKLQAALSEGGYMDAPVDGTFGKATAEGVMAFQREKGLKVDGKVGNETFAQLEADGFDDPEGAPAPDEGDTFVSSSSTSSGRVSGTLSGKVERGVMGSDARLVQEALKAKGFDVGMVDGNFGSKCVEALMRFQTANGLTADGKVGPKTAAALGLGMSATSSVTNNSGGSSSHIVARFNSYKSGTGMVSGTISLNGHTYRFNSGKGGAFSSPKGEYIVRRQGSFSDSRSGRAYSRGGIGFSFVMEGANRRGSDRMYDSRAGRDRGALRLHPDGGNAGTLGCLGIVADGAELKRFRSDLNAAIRANGGSIRLTVS